MGGIFVKKCEYAHKVFLFGSKFYSWLGMLQPQFYCFMIVLAKTVRYCNKSHLQSQNKSLELCFRGRKFFKGEEYIG